MHDTCMRSLMNVDESSWMLTKYISSHILTILCNRCVRLWRFCSDDALPMVTNCTSYLTIDCGCWCPIAQIITAMLLVVGSYTAGLLLLPSGRLPFKVCDFVCEANFFMVLRIISQTRKSGGFHHCGSSCCIFNSLSYATETSYSVFSFFLICRLKFEAFI